VVAKLGHRRLARQDRRRSLCRVFRANDIDRELLGQHA
jgi:hypothetical protein